MHTFAHNPVGDQRRRPEAPACFFSHDIVERNQTPNLKTESEVEGGKREISHRAHRVKESSKSSFDICLRALCELCVNCFLRVFRPACVLQSALRRPRKLRRLVLANTRVAVPKSTRRRGSARFGAAVLELQVFAFAVLRHRAGGQRQHRRISGQEPVIAEFLCDLAGSHAAKNRDGLKPWRGRGDG